jgi:hypothetical protein
LGCVKLLGLGSNRHVFVPVESSIEVPVKLGVLDHVVTVVHRSQAIVIAH